MPDEVATEEAGTDTGTGTEQVTDGQAAPPATEETGDQGQASETVETVGAAQQPETEEQDKPGRWPDDWRNAMAGGNEDYLKLVNRYQSPENVLKALANANKKISSGEFVKPRPDDPSDEKAWAEWREQVGVPETPEGYLDSLPDNVVFGEEDEDRLMDFTAQMHEFGAPPEYVHKALEWYSKAQENDILAMRQADEESKQAGEDFLREAWGKDFRPNLNAMHNFIGTYGSEELANKIFSARQADGVPLGNNPEFLDFLVSAALELNPHHTIAPGSGADANKSVDDEIDEIQKTMRENPKEYWGDEKKQARLRELLDWKDKYGKNAS